MPSAPNRSLGRRFARLTALNVLANLSVPLASLVDTALLGHLEEIRFLAGVALAIVLFEYVYWTFGFLRMGTTGLTAQALGRGDTSEVYLVLYRSLTIAGGVALALLLLQRPIQAIGFPLLGGAAGVEAAGRAYFGARIWGAPATLANFAFLGWFLGREESRHALTMTVVANVANILLDYLLIVRMGWAAFGAGVATAASQYLMLATAVALFVGRGRPVAWSWRRILDRRAMAALLRLNRDILLRTLALVTAFALFYRFSAALGTVVLAANTVLQRLVTLAAYVVDGAAFAVESLAGILFGLDDRAGLRRLRRMALTVGAVLPLPLLVAATLAPRRLFSLLTDHGPTLELAVAAGPWLWPCLLFGSAAFIYDGLFLGLTQGRALRNAMAVSVLVALLPLGLAAVALESNDVLWLAFTAFMLARALALRLASRRLPVG